MQIWDEESSRERNSKGMEWDRRGGRQGEEPCTPASSNSDTNTLVCHSVKLLSWSRLIQSWSVAADPSSWQILRGFLRSDDSLWTRSMKAEYFRARSRWSSSSRIDYRLSRIWIIRWTMKRVSIISSSDDYWQPMDWLSSGSSYQFDDNRMKKLRFPGKINFITVVD